MFTTKTASARCYNTLLLIGGAILLSAGCAPGAGGDGTNIPERTASPDQEALDSIVRHPSKAVCSNAAPGFARCHAHVRTADDGSGQVQPFATPQGITPANLQQAYNIPAGGTGTVAIVDAQDDPNAEADLAVYRKQFGLPPCTTANGCFTKVNQTGQTTGLPTGDTGWGGEISLDLDMVSAGCPGCKIILVEANSASNDDLGTAVNTAAAMGANAISNSYGGNEGGDEATYDSEYYNHPGIIITASSGDSGYGTEYPASGAHVLGVGGTSLAPSSGSARGWAEGAWSSGGSGCSEDVAKPSFQAALNLPSGCNFRSVADVSANANPNTGVAVYDTYGGSSADATGWVVYGGTSAASPLVAAILVGAGKGGIDNSWPYANTSAWNDVTTGSNGSCDVAWECNAGPGYDGPTGIGTPNGGAIQSGSGSSSSSSSGSSSGGSSSSSSGGGTSSSSSSSSTGSSGGGGDCEHPICSQGSALESSCDPCASKICAQDDYCCTTAWDSVCLGEVASICGDNCGGGGSSSSSGGSSSGGSSSGGSSGGGSSSGGGGGSCSHSECTIGAKLKTSCDPCVKELCAKDSYCCNNKWDKVCVGEVSSICGETCQ